MLSHPAYNSFCIWTAIFWHHTAFIIKHSITIMRWVREKVSSSSALVFYIHGSMHCDSILISSNEMQQYACVYLLQISSTCFGCLSHPSSGVHGTVNAASDTGHSVRATNFRRHGLLGHAGRRLLRWHYDLYQKLHLQFHALQMMGAIDTRNM